MRRQDLATLIALAIGFTIVGAVYGILSIVTGRSLIDEEPGLILLHAAMAAMPFLILAGKNIYDEVTWAVGLALTVPAWALFLYAGIRYDLSGDTSGVGGEAAILLVWPFFVSFACVKLGRSRPTV